MLWRDRLDLYRLEYAIVRARNRLDLALHGSGDRRVRKVFCLGPAKSGTSSLHALFASNGLRSLHSAGNWRLSDHDCFSDRGDYRPFKAYDRMFPNAVFVLNCRPLGSYLRSLAIHRRRDGAVLPTGLVNVPMLVGQARRRHDFHLKVLTHFAGRTNLIVVDIEKAGSMAFVADRLGLAVPETTHHHKTTEKLSAPGEAVLAEAIRQLGGPAMMGTRLALTPEDERAALAPLLPRPDNVWL